ncbi:hypothetical protein BDF22DRAFT_657672 [Syncephalis plumigaleata]|nr:hypothetical protein BDF22DRAFT_657672 [Syncephalis plumigaleata]
MNIGSPVTPQWRAFHTASLSGNYMIIYGGVANSRDAFSQPGTSDLFVYYIKDGRWYKPRMINAPTNGQRMHSAITIEDGMILFYATNFTGTDPESRNPIMMLYPSSWSWSIPKPNVSTPLSRVRQTFTYVNKRAYMYGGSTQDPNGDINTGSISNGLVEMNVESREWIDRPSGQARQGHTACYLSSSNSILVFGGVDNTFKTINQLNVYKLDDKTWDSSPVIDVDKGFPSARMGHTATCLDNKMIVFGGTPDNDGKSTVLSSNDIWVLESIDKGKKYLWSKPQMKNTNHAPPPRMDTWTWSHAEVDSMLPEPGEVSQDGEKKNDNGTVVIIVSVVCGLVGLLAIIAFILLGLRKRRARKLNNGQNSGTTIIVANGAANGTTSNGSKALLRKETLDDMSLGSQSPSSVEHPSMTEVANSGKYLNNNNGDNNNSSKRNSQNLLLIGRPVINSETNSPRDSNGDLSTAAASDPTPRVQRKGKRRVGRTTNASANTPSGIDDDDDDDDVDRWTFASSISFGQNANPNSKSRVFSNSHNNNSNNEIRPARYYPPLAALPRSRSMSQAVFRANLPAHSATPSESTSNDVTLPLTQVISPPMSPNLQPGSVISGMVSPLDQIARLRLNQMKRVGEGGDNSNNNNNNNNGDDGSGKQETAPTQNNELKPAYTTLHPDASSTTASIAAMLRDDVSENSSHKSNESPDEKIQVRGGDARESVEGYLVGTAGSRSITDPGVLHEESAEDALDGTDEDDGTGTKPALHRHPTLVRIGSDVLRPGSVLFNRYILLDRPAPNLATDAVVIYAADDTAGEMVVLKMFVSRTAWEREYVALRFLRSPQVAALRNIYNLADERTGTERYVLVTERYGRALPELLSKLDDNGDLDLNMRTGISRSIAECCRHATLKA